MHRRQDGQVGRQDKHVRQEGRSHTTVEGVQEGPRRFQQGDQGACCRVHKGHEGLVPMAWTGDLPACPRRTRASLPCAGVVVPCLQVLDNLRVRQRQRCCRLLSPEAGQSRMLVQECDLTNTPPTGSGAEPVPAERMNGMPGATVQSGSVQSRDRARARRSDATRQSLGVARGRTSAWQRGSPAMISSMFGCVLVVAGVALIAARRFAPPAQE